MSGLVGAVDEDLGRPTLSLVLPVFNEAEVVPELHKRLQEFLPGLKLPRDACEVLFVDDGSRDASFDLLQELCAAEPRYRILSFARNFGHQAAITAGIDHARGRAVVVMDADLQDPPEVVVEMIAKWREGYDVVYAIRRKREGESWFKLFTARWFYRLFAAMIPIEVPLDAGDFRLMSRKVVIAFRELRETHRFVRGMVAWLGFRQTRILYDRPGRFAGQTKFPLRKMVRFALDGITSFSIVPLRFSTYIGIVMSTSAIAIAVWAVLAKFVFHETVTGWTATIVIMTLFASVQFLMIGILGEYVGRIFEEVKRRPLYVVRESVNFAERGSRLGETGERHDLLANSEPAQDLRRRQDHDESV
jgi:dolichol-phosphate mannosyltransferase